MVGPPFDSRRLAGIDSRQFFLVDPAGARVELGVLAPAHLALVCLPGGQEMQ